MADQHGSASTADAPPPNPYSMPMSINVADIVEEEEDEDEYEYEYSTTEKEAIILKSSCLSSILICAIDILCNSRFNKSKCSNQKKVGENASSSQC